MEYKRRFWKKVAVSRSEDCWPWLAGKFDERGYGCYQVAGRCRRAHRYAYEIAVGPIPAGMHVCHKCDNPSCVNPSHLFLGTHDDNMADKLTKGRAPRGEQNAAAKLTAPQVIEIRRRAAEREATNAMLAKEFGVSTVMVSKIVRRRNWRSI